MQEWQDRPIRVRSGLGTKSLFWCVDQLTKSADTSYATRPAAFGPQAVDAEGLWGHLLPIRLFYGTPNHDGLVPNDGCPGHTQDSASANASSFNRLLRGSKPRKPPKNWIALVERGNCSFVEKVRLAQELGAIAVVVGDAKYEYDEDSAIDRLVNLRDIPWDNDELDQGATRPITMFPDGDAENITIPSCFVIRSSYLELLELVHESLSSAIKVAGRSESGLEVGLFLDSSLSDLSTLDLGMLFLFLPTILTVGFLIIQHIKMLVKQYRERASTHAVHSLPCYTWHADRDWELVATTYPDDPPKGAGMKALGFYYLARASEWAQNRLAPRSPGAAQYESISGCHSGGTDELEGQRTHSPSPLHAASAPPGVSAALDARRYVQDVCPICLSEFVEG